MLAAVGDTREAAGDCFESRVCPRYGSLGIF
jgi:hypothetical protein